ncbi:hypothetical protein BSKO_08520 [Bryopsis sp. KO-2023]|nr:hypothetical protein BSKO_08520 [Bryopsis sp. KO-2023]
MEKNDSEGQVGKKSDEVVYSGEAFRIVSSWLGGDVNDDDDVGTTPAAPRPPGLGLGAKFLPHKKGVALNAGAEKSLGKRIGGGVGPIRGAIRTNQESSDESEELLPCTSSDEEEESKVAAVFSKRKKIGEKRLASDMRAELLSAKLNNKESKSSRKRKNRNRNKKNRKNQEGGGQT